MYFRLKLIWFIQQIVGEAALFQGVGAKRGRTLIRSLFGLDLLFDARSEIETLGNSSKVHPTDILLVFSGTRTFDF